MSPRKPRDVFLVAHGLLRLPSRLPSLSSLARTALSSCALSFVHAWARPLLVYAGIAGCCAFVYSALSIRGMCYSMTEAVGVTSQITVSIVRTLARFALVRGGRQRFPNWTLQLEVVVDALRLVLERCGDRVAEPWAASALRRRSVFLGSMEGRLACFLTGGVALETVHFRGLHHFWIKSTLARESADGAERSQQQHNRRVVLFFHGGGFAMACPESYSSSTVRIVAAIKSELATGRYGDKPLHVDLLLANYRKAPEHPYPAGPDDAYAMYRYLVDHEGLHPSQIIVAGDSAGASLALTTLTTIRDVTPEAQPLAGVLLCPFIDLDPANVPENHEAPHCVLSKEAALGSLRGYASGDVTPICNHDNLDLRGLPPMFVQAATLDLLYSHAVQLVSRARQQTLGAAKWELDVHENMPHDFSMFPAWLVPHSNVAVARIAAFVAQQVTSVPQCGQ